MFGNFFNKKNNNNNLIGVNITPNEIAIAHIVYARNKDDKPTLKLCDYSKDPISDKNFSSTHSNLLKKFPLKKYPCNSIINNNKYELMLINPPNVEPSELKQAIKWRIRDQLAFHVDDAVIDIFDIPGQSKSKSKVMYTVVAQKKDVNERVELLKESGFNIESIDINELSQRNVTRLMKEDKDGIICIKLNKNDGLLTITKNGILYLSRKIEY